jgi:hypothetical protein
MYIKLLKKTPMVVDNWAYNWEVWGTTAKIPILFTISFVFMVAVGSAAFGQQRTTCSQQADWAASGCPISTPHVTRQCQANVQQKLTECLASGTWQNPNTGQVLTFKKE